MSLQEGKIVFSVIMPCYNSELFVSTAIDSLKNSSYPNWELIIVNDGSTDQTGKIINNYAHEEPRIRIINKKNGGYVSAVNTGLEAITGDYFLLLGSDDYLSNGLFSRLYEEIENMGLLPDSIAFRTVKVFDGKIKGIDNYTKFFSVASETETNLKNYSTNNPDHAAILFTRDTSKCYKRELLKDQRYFGKYGMAADGIFSMLYCHKATSYLAVPFDGYYWTLRDDSVSASASYSVDKQIDMINNWMLFIQALSQLPMEEITAKELEWSATPMHLLVELSMTLNNVIRYNKYIKNNLRKLKRYEKSGLLPKMNVPSRIASISPMLFFCIYKAKSLLQIFRKME